MKIKFLAITAVLIIVILFSYSFVKAQTADNSALMVQLEAKIQSLAQQVNQLLAQQNTIVSATNSAWCYTFNTNLGFAQSGTNDVVQLHTALQKQGISYAPDDVNTYSTGTSQAVIAFQIKYGITPATGYVGTKTRAELNSLYGCANTYGSSNPTVVATYTLTYASGLDGSISGAGVDASSNGTITQKINSGANGKAVTAVANQGYQFVKWSDGSTQNPRTDTNVTQNISVTANFTAAGINCTPKWIMDFGGTCIGNEDISKYRDYNNCNGDEDEEATVQSNCGSNPVGGVCGGTGVSISEGSNLNFTCSDYCLSIGHGVLGTGNVGVDYCCTCAAGAVGGGGGGGSGSGVPITCLAEGQSAPSSNPDINCCVGLSLDPVTKKCESNSELVSTYGQPSPVWFNGAYWNNCAKACNTVGGACVYGPSWTPSVYLSAHPGSSVLNDCVTYPPQLSSQTFGYYCSCAGAKCISQGQQVSSAQICCSGLTPETVRTGTQGDVIQSETICLAPGSSCYNCVTNPLNNIGQCNQACGVSGTATPGTAGASCTAGGVLCATGLSCISGKCSSTCAFNAQTDTATDILNFLSGITGSDLTGVQYIDTSAATLICKAEGSSVANESTINCPANSNVISSADASNSHLIEQITPAGDVCVNGFQCGACLGNTLPSFGGRIVQISETPASSCSEAELELNPIIQSINNTGNYNFPSNAHVTKDAITQLCKSLGYQTFVYDGWGTCDGSGSCMGNMGNPDGAPAIEWDAANNKFISVPGFWDDCSETANPTCVDGTTAGVCENNCPAS